MMAPTIKSRQTREVQMAKEGLNIGLAAKYKLPAVYISRQEAAAGRPDLLWA